MSEKTLRGRYREFKQLTGISDKLVSQNIGLSQAVISQWLNEKYTGDNTVVEKAISEYLDHQDTVARQGKITIPFVGTENAKQVFAIIKRVRLDKTIALITGDSGTGKTYSIDAWVSEHPRTSILIRVNVTYNPKILIAQLHKALGMGGHGNKNTMLADCVESLKNTDRIVIVDEADLLGVASIELLRALHDEAGIGIVLMGLPAIAETVRGSRGELARINTRIVNMRRLEPLSLNDVTLIANTLISEGERFAQSFLNLTKGNGRLMGNLLKNVVRVHREKGYEITPKLIEACYEMQYR